MTRVNRRLAARVIWAVAVAAIVILVGVGVVVPSPSGGAESVANFVAFLAFILSFGAVGAVIAAKRPDHPIGWLLLGSAICYAVGGAGVSMPVADDGAVTLPLMLAWAGSWAWGLGVGLAVVVLLLFPDGRLPSRRWKPVLWLVVALMVASVLGAGFGSPTIGNGPTPNPFVVSGAAGTTLAALGAMFPLVLVTAVLAVASILLRFRRARGAEHQQVKWFLYAAMLVGLALLAQIPLLILVSDPAAATAASNAILTGAFAAVPAAIGIAILRYRLWDIDRIVSRTVSWAVVTGFLAVVFAGLVVGLQQALAQVTGASTLAVAGSTLVVFALFSPLRHRVQGFVDRRFDRARYDAERTVETLTARLRDETDLERVGSEIEATVHAALAPRLVVVWTRDQ
jgi:hypothetical protein